LGVKEQNYRNCPFILYIVRIVSHSPLDMPRSDLVTTPCELMSNIIMKSECTADKSIDK